MVVKHEGKTNSKPITDNSNFGFSIFFWSTHCQTLLFAVYKKMWDTKWNNWFTYTLYGFLGSVLCDNKSSIFPTLIFFLFGGHYDVMVFCLHKSISHISRIYTLILIIYGPCGALASHESILQSYNVRSYTFFSTPTQE